MIDARRKRFLNKMVGSHTNVMRCLVYERDSKVRKQKHLEENNFPASHQVGMGKGVSSLKMYDAFGFNPSKNIFFGET